MIPRPASTDQLDGDGEGGGGDRGSDNNAASTLLRSSSRAGTLDGKRSSSRPMSHQSYQHPVYQDIPMPKSKCQSCLMTVNANICGPTNIKIITILLFKQLRTCLVGSLERAFFHYGRFVAKYPWAAAFACVMLAIGCGAGISRMTRETRVVRIWISEQSSTR